MTPKRYVRCLGNETTTQHVVGFPDRGSAFCDSKALFHPTGSYRHTALMCKGQVICKNNI